MELELIEDNLQIEIACLMRGKYKFSPLFCWVIFIISLKWHLAHSQKKNHQKEPIHQQSVQNFIQSKKKINSKFIRNGYFLDCDFFMCLYIVNCNEFFQVQKTSLTKPTRWFLWFVVNVKKGCKGTWMR